MFADEIRSTAKPKEMDEFFLKEAERELQETALNKNGSSFLGKIKTRFKARLIEKFAKECDLKTTVKQDAEKYIMQAKEKMPSLEPTNLSGKIKHIINVRRNNNQTSRYYKNQWLHYIGKRRTYLKEY